MNRILLALAAVLVISGCVTSKPTIITRTEIVVVTPPDELLTCDEVKTAYNTETMKVKQSNQYIIALNKRLKECASNAKLAREFIAQAKSGIADINSAQQKK